MKIFSGSSNQGLAAKIAKILSLRLGEVELSRFPNGECRVWVTEQYTNSECIVVQSFSNPPDNNIIEFCLIVDALKRMGAKKITAVIPWFGYCIQDKVFRPGEPLTSKVIAKIIQNTGVDKLITVDFHNETILGFFDIPVVHLSATTLFIDYFKKNEVIDLVISPDVGALKKATKMAQALNLPIAVINKKRDLSSGKVEIVGVDQKIEGKTVLINDDFTSTGQTLIKAAEFLKNQGVKKIYASLAHHFYAPGLQEKIEASQLDKLFVTDTIQSQEIKKWKKLEIISIANLLAKELKNC